MLFHSHSTKCFIPTIIFQTIMLMQTSFDETIMIRMVSIQFWVDFINDRNYPMWMNTSIHFVIHPNLRFDHFHFPNIRMIFFFFSTNKSNCIWILVWHLLLLLLQRNETLLIKSWHLPCNELSIRQFRSSNTERFFFHYITVLMASMKYSKRITTHASFSCFASLP